MNINFDIDIDINKWAEAIGYKIVGDKIIKGYNLSDFKEAIKEYIEAQIDSGCNPNTIEQNFFENDKGEFKLDFEYEYKSL